MDNTQRTHWEHGEDWKQVSSIFLKGGHPVKHRPACVIFVTEKNLKMIQMPIFKNQNKIKIKIEVTEGQRQEKKDKMYPSIFTNIALVRINFPK